MYIPRAIESTLRQVSDTFPAVLLTGPRQVGKTTVLRHIAQPDRAYVTLDDPDQRMLAQSDPRLFLQRFPAPVLIDEIQYAPELLPYIKMAIDDSGEAGMFWLTGSQVFRSMRDVGESLAGRVGILELQGLSYAEAIGRVSEPFTVDIERLTRRERTAPPMDIRAAFERIHRGGMPALHARPGIDRAIFFASYVDTYLRRDIHDLTQVANERAFHTFMISVAARTAHTVVYEELARDAGISAPTAKKWLSLLASSHIIALVEPWHDNALKRAVKMPLLHFLDTGLCAHLLKWTSPDVLERGAMGGAFFETWVFSEIYKSYINAGKTPPLYYYRDKDKREIDLIIAQNDTLSPLEIKKSASPGRDAARHFSVLSKARPLNTGGVLCMAETLLPISKDNWLIPARLL